MRRRASKSDPLTSVGVVLTRPLSSLIRTPELEEDGIRIALTIVDTPGFGDNINNEASCVSPFITRPFSCSCHSSSIRFQEIMNYLERQYDDILAEQSRIKRNPRFKDNRVHALLYFIPPTGHAYASYLHFPITSQVPHSSTSRLREMDIELMRRLSPRVNVIPVIGKADSLTPRELQAFKKRVCSSKLKYRFWC